MSKHGEAVVFVFEFARARKLSAPVQKFANVFSVFSGSDLSRDRELGKQGREVGFGELPGEGFGR